MSTSSWVKFHFLESFSLKDRARLKSFIIGLMRAEGQPASQLSYVFCSDDYLLKINQDFLQHNDLTDIITFDLSEDVRVKTGEIYISVDRVRENAESFGVGFAEELYRVMFHGALHLCGYGDKEDADKTLMRAKEDFYLRQYP